MGVTRDEWRRFSRPVLKTKRWQVLRQIVLERDGWACVDCGTRKGRLEIDHVKPVRSNPELAFDPANCATRCSSCHTKKTRIECGHPAPIITPTSKEFDGGHDAPLTADEIIRDGILTPALWDEVSAVALALFARGQHAARARGLILADTKYEFGIDAEGRLLVADEIHTPDSSRYWHADGLEAALRDGTRPPSFDKDVIRAWVAARCDPYHDPIPEIPTEMILETSRVYIEACEAITGAPFVPDLAGETPLARIRANLAPYFTTPPA